MTKKTSAAGIELLKNFEGCRLKAYKALPTEKYYTIGYGHSGSDVKQGMTISLLQAEALLKSDLKGYENFINNYVMVHITQNMFDALISLSYNCGVSAVKSSTLLKKLNKKKYIGAANQFMNWTKSGGKVIPGLTERRTKERILFLKGYCDKPKKQVSKTTAKTSEIRWIQWKLEVKIDGIWGDKTAAAVRAKRKSLGWSVTSGYTCTINLITALDK
ncbi:glycoside hydrolase family protein [Anaerocolumna chitinilytica]|uniref:Lysozyme n=1 Tax=Anaerocolumna chitinilytica TaxID=1727145 RepID=A0A7I8DR38_9FIRM|nr:lysozyme [Anaerocolumna chitinilytica]BCK00850.1 hypothetical protein bsdcttw_38900 [Anaerocolumna chitinilytica]